MADDEIDSGLFNINLSDSEDGEAGQTTFDTATNGGGAGRDRKGQTEAEFQAVKASYRAKVENGEIWKQIEVPLGRRKLSKQEAQEVLHAVEELYFYRRYAEAVAFVGRVFQGQHGANGLDGDAQEVLRTYERKCLVKLGRTEVA